jgi:hypothetical protein
MNIFSPPAELSSIWLASGSRCVNVDETRWWLCGEYLFQLRWPVWAPRSRFRGLERSFL